MRFIRFIDSSAALPAPQWGLLEQDQVTPLTDAPYTNWAGNGDAPHITRAGAPLRLADVRLLAPVTPSKLVCVGRNYAEHAAELGNEVPTEPLIFLKPPSSVIGPDAAVVYPRLSQRVDHEGELAVLIGRRCRHLSEAAPTVHPEHPESVIFGYTIANDVTARDLQRQDGQWTRGKGFDTFAPVGPWIDTDFDPANRTVRCRVNNELRQDGNTNLLIYSIAHVLAYVTAFMTLEPGDLLLTGTPAGVGPVKPGDVMVVEIDGLGQLSNPVVAEDSNG